MSRRDFTPLNASAVFFFFSWIVTLSIFSLSVTNNVIFQNISLYFLIFKLGLNARNYDLELDEAKLYFQKNVHKDTNILDNFFQ